MHTKEVECQNWMKGVDIFNSIGNKIGKSLLKIDKPEFDVGTDALRTPFENLIEQEKLAKNLDDNAIAGLRKKLSTFKFGKVITSTLLAIGFVGFALPKIYQGITDKIMKKEQNQKDQNQTIPQNTINAEIKKQSSFSEF